MEHMDMDMSVDRVEHTIESLEDSQGLPRPHHRQATPTDQHSANSKDIMQVAGLWTALCEAASHYSSAGGCPHTTLPQPGITKALRRTRRSTWCYKHPARRIWFVVAVIQQQEFLPSLPPPLVAL
jgi:hypothetical protein